VLIAKAIGMEYDTLISEIMVGGLRRMRDKRREERESERKDAKQAATPELTAKPPLTEKEKAEKAAKRMAKLNEQKAATAVDAAVRAVRRERSEPIVTKTEPEAVATVVPATLGSTSTH